MKTLKYLFLLSLLVSAFFSELNATDLAYDKFTNRSSDGYSRDDGWKNQLKVKGKKKSYKTYNFGSTYANTTVEVTFKMKWKGSWENSGTGQDYFKVYFNNNLLIDDTFSGNASSWHSYTQSVTTDGDGKLKIEFYANSTSSSEYIAVDDVKITASSTPIVVIGGCDNTLDDTVPNNSAPGALIPAMNGITTDTTACISGYSIDGTSDKRDYYYFTVNTYGTLTITTSSPNNEPYHLVIGSSENGDEYYSDTIAITHNISQISLSSGGSVYIQVTETGSELDEYQLNFDFQAMPIVENADDLCYEEAVSSGMFCMDMGICHGGMGCRNTYPLKNIGDGTLSNVNAIYDESGMGGSFGSHCGVTPSGTCQSKSGVDMGPIGMLGSTTTYQITNDIPVNDSSNAVWSENFMAMSCMGGNNFYATYVKNGQYYRGELHPCNTAPAEPGNETVPQDDTSPATAECDTFADMFQTRSPCGGGGGGSITFTNAGQLRDGSTDVILNASGSSLNTCNLSAPSWVTNQFETCGSGGDCSASGSASTALTVGYVNTPAAVSLSATPSDDHSNDVTLSATPTTLSEFNYGTVTTSWHTGYSATFDITNQLRIDTLKMTNNNTFMFESGAAYSLEIGTLGIENNGADNTVSTDANAKNIKIKDFNLAAGTTVDFAASQTIKMEHFTVGYHSTVTLKAQYVNINTLTLSSSGSGEAAVTIIADYVDIGTLDIQNHSDGSTFRFQPYTPGARILFRANTVNEGSNSTLLLDSGNYYVGTISLPGTSDVSAMRASSSTALINFYVNDDLTPGNNPGINSDGNNANYGSNPAANFMLFVNGDITTGGGGTTFNATIYAEGSITMGNPTYVKGAMSANDSISAGQGQFTYDQSISSDGWGECTSNVNKPDFEGCGYFPSALATYQTLHMDNNPGNGNKNIVINSDNIVADSTDPDPISSSQATCNGSPCSVDAPPADRLTFPPLLSGGSDMTISGTTTLSAADAYANSSTKYKVIHDLAVNTNNVTLTFTSGHYYIDNFTVNANGFSLKTDTSSGEGPVYLFIRGDMSINSNSISIDAAKRSQGAGDLYIFINGNFDTSQNSQAQYDVVAYFYTKGQFKLSTGSASGQGFKGAITSENDLSINKNHAFIYDPTGLDANGMGSCDTLTCARPKEFSIIYTVNTNGNIKLIGNTNICEPNGSGGCKDPGTKQNNSIDAIWRDGDGDGATVNSSAALLDLNGTATVLWAGLYWQGYFSGNNLTAIQPTAKQIKFGFSDSKNGGVSYTSLTADRLNHVYFSDSRWYYQGYKNVTDLVKSLGSGWYWGADLQTTLGKPPGGTLGAWSIAIVYSEPDASVKNLTIFDGYLGLAGNNDVNNAKDYANNHNCDNTKTGVQKESTMQLSGFKTPKSGNVDSRLLFFAGEGDIGLTGDNLWLTDLGGTEQQVTNAANPNNNIANSSITDGGVHRETESLYPYYGHNTIGIDIDTFDVSNIIGNDQTSTRARMNTNGDGYFPGIFGFATELYIPSICYDYTLAVQGHTVASQENRIITPFGGFGADLQTNILVRSLEGDLSLHDVNLTYVIADTTQLVYKNGSTAISPDGEYNYVDASAQTYGESDRGFGIYIGSGASASGGGTVGPNEARFIRFFDQFLTPIVNTSFDLILRYTVNYGAGDVPITKYLNSNDLCSGSGTGNFQPVYALFNAVESTAAYDQYNLFTHVSGAPFAFKVYAYDPNDITALRSANDLNLSIEMEMINADRYANDANAVCEDYDSILQSGFQLPVKAVSIQGKVGSVSYENSETNFAHDTVAFRFRYIVDANGSLLNDHNCSMANPAGCLDLYAREALSTFTVDGVRACDNPCALQPNPTACYDCIMEHFSSLGCGRDTFAIRPSTLLVTLYDANQSDNIDDPANRIAASDTAANTIDLVAGYNYRFDINATSLASPLAQGYQQDFTLFQNDALKNKRSFMNWAPSGAVNCNDTVDKNISMYLFDGSTVNLSRRTATSDKVTQIGRYMYSIYDANWTRTDWNPNDMRQKTGPFAQFFNQAPDCIEGSSSNTPDANGRVGCRTASRSVTSLFHPYKIATQNVQVLTPNTNGFIYMNTPGAADDNMSLSVIGQITLRNYDNSVATNFVNGCYAEPLFLAITPNLDQNYTYYLNGSDANSSTVNSIVAQTTNFTRELNGSMLLDVHFNRTRQRTVPQNPATVQFQDLNITLGTQNVPVELLNTYTPFGTVAVDRNLTFLYGRAHASRIRTLSPQASFPVAYEFYYQAANSLDDQTLQAFSSTNNRSKDSVFWYVNTLHNSVDGNITNGVELVSSNDMTLTPTANFVNGEQTVDYTYSGGDYPYRATLMLTTQPWLVYHPYDSNVTNVRIRVPIEINDPNPQTYTNYLENEEQNQTDNPNRPRRIQW